MMAEDLPVQPTRQHKQKRSPSPSHRHHHQHHQHHHHHHDQRQQQQNEWNQQLHQDHGSHPSTADSEQRQVIVIAMDGSTHSFYAFDWYMHHLHTPDNQVVVVHTCPQSNTFLTHAHSLMPSVTSDDPGLMNRLAVEDEEVNQIVARIKGRLTTSGVRGKLVRLSGEAGSTIVQAAKDYKAVCIVTGSRGLGTVKRTLIGSVSDYILHHAHCPVLVCRHKESKA